MNKARHPHRNVDHKAEQRADRELKDCLFKNLLGFDRNFNQKEKGVREKNVKPHGEARSETQHVGSGRDGARP